MKLKKHLNWKTFKELFVYGVVGGCTTIINFSIYLLCTRIFHLNPTLSNCLAWLVAVNFAYLADKVFVFHAMDFSLGALAKEMSSFYGMRLISGAVDVGMFFVLVELMHFNDLVSKVGVQVVVIVLNFVFSKFFIFSNRK